ncbi:MAG: GNAT family N-acetyltransferase [Candidatus Pacebacteria bacterium]|nr:GNAT family N-acetyltransferase [Candidatus Paceibacterota bacterium]
MSVLYRKPQNSSDSIALFSHFRDLHQSPMYAKTMKAIGWETIGKSGSYIFVRKIGPLQIMKAQRIEVINLNEIRKIKKERWTIVCQIEPALSAHIVQAKEFESLPTTSPLAHTKTSIIDLRLTEDQLLAQMKQKTRYNIRLAQRKNVIKIREIPLEKLTPEDLKKLFELKKEWEKKQFAVAYPSNFLLAFLHEFAGHGSLFIAEIEDQWVAALIVPMLKCVATYYTAFSTQEGYLEHAPTLLTWEALRKSKKHGCKVFDFGGIYDERFPQDYKHWRGFTIFKEGFGTKEIIYERPRKV